MCTQLEQPVEVEVVKTKAAEVESKKPEDSKAKSDKAVKIDLTAQAKDNDKANVQVSVGDKNKKGEKYEADPPASQPAGDCCVLM